MKKSDTFRTALALFCFGFTASAAYAETCFCAPRTALNLRPGPGNARNSEGDFALLKDGRILFAYSKFKKSGGDDGASVIAARVSSDRGETWGGDRVLAVNDEGPFRNAMSASFLRLKDGRLALFYAIKDFSTSSNLVTRKMMKVSADEGETWGSPKDCTAGLPPAYRVVNNARIIRLKSGRVLIPAAEHSSKGKDIDAAARPMCLYSDDDCATWKASAYVQKVLKADGNAHQFQEPGVVELKDGRVMMWFRTNEGRQWLSYSSNGGISWLVAGPSSLYSPLSPATIRRLTSGELVCIWNDHEGRDDLRPAGMRWANGVRTPLTLGFSTDEGKTWTRRQTIEGAYDAEKPYRYWYCYTAFLELDDRALLAYCAEDNLSLSRIVILPKKGKESK